MTDDILEQIKNMQIVLNISQPAKPKFYAHVDFKTHDILSITPTLSDNPDKINLEIEYDLAEKFLTGKENIFLWTAVQDKEVMRLVKKQDLRFIKRDRTELLRLVEITSSNRHSDVRVEICNDCILVRYDGEKIKYAPSPIKLYVTGEQNPADLKYTFTLNVNILNKIMHENNLPEWPNPIRLPIDDPEDVSIYTIKSNMSISVIRNEIVNN